MNKLRHLYVMVTRPDPQGSELCQLIEAQGGRALHLPTIAIAPPPDLLAFRQAIRVLGGQEWLIFISPQAVYASIAAIKRAWPEFPRQTKFAAIGAATANALEADGYAAAIHPTTEWNSESLLALPAFWQVAGKYIAIIRGAGGREWLEKTLIARGAKVTSVMAYQRVLPQVDTQECLNLLEQHSINRIVCTSFTGVSNLKQLFSEKGWLYLKTIVLIVPSWRIKILAQDLGFQTIWVARNASHQAMLEILSGCEGIKNDR